jgi:hypothetical protein
MLNRVNVTSFTTGSIATMAINGIPSPMKSLNISTPSQCAIGVRDRQWASQADARAIIVPWFGQAGYLDRLAMAFANGSLPQ